jgi:hypothetical protein
LNLVFCMAGLYARFRRAGYALPKYLLPVEGGESLLAAIVAPFAKSGCFHRVLFVANRRDEAHRLEIETVARAAGAPAEVVFIGDTGGQAETACLALDVLAAGASDPVEKVVFHNVDTILENRDFCRLSALLDEYDGVIDVFDADRPIYSYVALDAAGTVVDIAEKVVLSRHATSGLYAFASGRRFTETFRRATFPAEAYISDVYKQMLREGARLAVYRAENAADTLILGTPLEYEAYLATLPSPALGAAV